MKPIGWTRKRLDELGFIGRGKSKHRPRNEPSLYGGPYPFIQTADIMAADPYITAYSQTYSELGFRQSKMWPVNTLCMTIAGANTAKVAILKIEACFPDSVIGFIPDKSKADLHFVMYSLRLMKDQFLAVSRGATQDNLGLNKLLSFPLSVPDVDTQRRIAGILSAYDELIENNKRRIALLEKMAEEIYREWFVRLRFPGHEKVKKVKGMPEGWIEQSIGDLCKVARGSSPRPITDQGFFANGTIPWIKIADATASKMFIYETKEYVNEFGASFSRKLAKGDLIIATSGTLGFCIFLGVEGCVHDGWMYLSNYKDNLKPIFLYYLINQYREYLNSLSYGAAIQNINTEIIRRLPIRKPPKDILEKFYMAVEPIHDKIFKLGEINRKLVTMRDMLLPRLVSGKLSVENLDIQFPPGMAEELP